MSKQKKNKIESIATKINIEIKQVDLFFDLSWNAMQFLNNLGMIFNMKYKLNIDNTLNMFEEYKI